MPKYLHLDIPKPCHEDWNKMSPEAQGRFCGSCQKTVTDFSNMSDAQLIAFFKNPKPSVCGRFTQEQLERDILIPRKRIPWVKYFFQFTLPAFLWSLKSSGQMGKVGVNTLIQTMAVEKPSKLLGDTTASELTTINGIVKNWEGKPVPYASVYIKGSLRGGIADSLGNFSINQVLLPCTVSVSCVGFMATEVHVPYNQKNANIQIKVEPKLQQVIVGGAVVVHSRKIRKTKKELKKEVCLKPKALTLALSVYPNPVQRSVPLHLKWQNLEAGNYRIEIYNTVGALMKAEKLLLEKEMKETSLAISELPAGNYFARLINAKTGKQITEQFIVRE